MSGEKIINLLMIYNDEFESEKNLQDSIENIEYIKDKNEKNETIKIIWKSSREIIKKMWLYYQKL